MSEIDISRILTKGLQSSISSTAIVDGTLRFTTDSGNLYLDHNSSRIKITDVISGYTDAQIKALQSPLDTKLYMASDTHKVYVFNSTTGLMVDIGAVTPQVTTENSDLYLWMSGTGSVVNPKYNSALKFNPSTGVLTAGNIEISKTEELDGTKVMNFSIV